MRVVDSRRFDEPREVEVEHDGAWWPGFQMAWRLLDDDRGWCADVEWRRAYDWGTGKHVGTVPANRVRPRS